MSKATIERVRDAVNFDSHELDYRRLTDEQRLLLQAKPKTGSKCRVRRNPNARSSAYGQMWEFGEVCGYMQSAEGVRALVIFTEREDADCDAPEWAFVELACVREFKPERVKEFKL